MQTFFIILNNELTISFRNLGKIVANFLFFIISIATFSLLAQNQIDQQSAAIYLSLIIWFSITSCLIFSSAEFLKKDFQDGTVEQILTSIDNFEIFVLAKITANWVIYALPAIISIFFIGLTSGFSQEINLNFLALISLATIAINFICAFCGSLSVLENSAPMIGVIALPLIIPILLIGNSGLSHDAANLKLLSGICILLGFISVFAAAKIVKIAAE